MPINTGWKNMLSSLRSQYCSKGASGEARDLADGSKFSMCKKGWTVFFATMRKKGWDETKTPAKHVTSETVQLAIQETVQDIIDVVFPLGGVVGAKQNSMEKRSGIPASDGRVFALTNDKKAQEAKEVVEWFESRYKPKPVECPECGK